METRTTFHKSLREVEEAVLAMGNMVVKAIDRAIDGLKKRDLTLAHQIIADDAQINKQRFSIEDDCIGLIATQQPVAGDLRIIVAIQHHHRVGTNRRLCRRDCQDCHYDWR